MEGTKKDERTGKESPLLQIDPKWCVRYIVHRLHRWPLSGCSIQDALRTFLQPIKTEDPRLDFYTMYKGEATEYDTDYVKKYDEDLNTTLIFVRYYHFLSPLFSLVLIGGSLFCRQLSIRHRRPFQTPARSKRPIGSPPPCHPPHPQSVCDPGWDPHRSACSGRSTE